MVKLFVYKTVKCEVFNDEFLSRDLPFNNSAIIVKWKCLKLLYSSNIIHLKNRYVWNI